ncbi:MAG TPA: SEC-C metal-binding domain-containing protein [Kofleriaceae bacterium]|nr:SEC-C metal-binding domain-containing protein [Kofleriaceae bacterium]
MVMAAAKNPKGMPISRVLVEEASAKRSDIDLMRAAGVLDFHRAAAIAFARARAGESVRAEDVNQILPWIREATLAASLCAIATGDRAACWMGCVRDRMFPVSEAASPIEIVVLYAAWRAGAPAEQIAPEARRLAHQRIGVRGWALLFTLATGLGDANLLEAVRHFRVMSQFGSGPEHVAKIDRILGSSITEILDAMPAELPPQAARGYTIRIAPRVGRNEPCPCGSRQKFKKCCADKQPKLAPSPVAGLSWDEYVTKGGEHMSGDDVRGLPLHELGRVDLRQLGEMSLVAAAGRFNRERLFAHASRAADELARREVKYVDELRDEILAEALDATDIDAADEQLRKMKDPAAAGLHKLEVDLMLGRECALEALAKAADEAVRKDESPKAVDLAHALLRAMPGLGILVARGCMRPGRAVVNDHLLSGIEHTRDALNLASGDPAWDVHAALKREHDADEDDAAQDKLAAEATELRGSLRNATTRLDDLERQLAAKQSELETARSAARAVERTAAANDNGGDPDRVRRLKMKLEELEGLMRERNAERSELRRQLAAVTSSARAQVVPAGVDIDENANDRSCDPVDDVERDVTLPLFSRKAHDALDELPRNIAAEALRTIGALAAGDAAAWRRVKQAKDMSRPVLMARVGIHYRMLFAVEGSALEVIDVIHRADLDARLKRLRRSTCAGTSHRPLRAPATPS